MLSWSKKMMPDGARLLYTIVTWAFCALLLLAAATFIANTSGLGEGSLGYISSAISFLAAAAAGFRASRGNQSGGLAGAFITATALVILLLSIGFLIKGEEMDPSSVISLVSFTYAGVLFGTVLSPKKEKSSSRHRMIR